jgi:hypothetical protein
MSALLDACLGHCEFGEKSSTGRQITKIVSSLKLAASPKFFCLQKIQAEPARINDVADPPKLFQDLDQHGLFFNRTTQECRQSRSAR